MENRLNRVFKNIGSEGLYKNEYWFNENVGLMRMFHVI